MFTNFLLFFSLFLMLIAGATRPVSAETITPDDIITKSPWVDVRAYDGDLIAACSASHGKKVLVPSPTLPLPSSYSTPADVQIEVTQGGLINTGTNPLTMNGSFSAGLYQAFSGGGTVTFAAGSVKEIYPEWWGAKADNLTNSSTAIARAIAAGSADIVLEEGIYKANFTVSKSNVSIRGQAPRATWIKPYTNAPVITLDSASGSVQYTTIKNLGFDNTNSGFSNDGIKFTGTNINDYVVLDHLYIQGFASGLKITGRTILSTFRDILVQSSTANGIHIEGSSDTMALNGNNFINVASNGSAGHGIYIKDTGSTGWYSNNWHSCNFEANGVSGFRLDGGAGGFSGGGGIYDSYLENNTDRGFYATGTVLIGFSFKNNLCWGSISGTDYENNVTLSTGEVKFNRFAGAVKTALTHSASLLEFSGNYGSTYTFTDDMSGNNHVNLTTPTAFQKGKTQITRYTDVVTTISFTGSPQQYTNNGYADVDIFYVGGNVTLVYFQRTGFGGDYMPLNSIYRLSPGDIIYFTYTSAPTAYVIPR